MNVAAGPEVVAAYGLYRRMKKDANIPPLPSHMGFLIDKHGYLRARWIPRDFHGWNALSALLGELDRLAHESPHRPAPAASQHNH